MKKSILYLLAILFTTCCITSCGDDEKTDDPVTPTEETWKELSKTYENDNLSLTMGETALTAAGKNIKFDAQSATGGYLACSLSRSPNVCSRVGLHGACRLGRDADGHRR